MYSTLAQPKSASPVPNQYSGPMPQHHATHRHASTPNVQLRNVSAFPAFLFFAHSRHITATARMGTGTVGERAAIRRYDD